VAFSTPVLGMKSSTRVLTAFPATQINAWERKKSRRSARGYTKRTPLKVFLGLKDRDRAHPLTGRTQKAARRQRLNPPHPTVGMGHKGPRRIRAVLNADRAAVGNCLNRGDGQ